jgi:tRNA A37 threonylcarbamoyladenosine synthetase subunit TsaC/SUA5/YrdC
VTKPGLINTDLILGGVASVLASDIDFLIDGGSVPSGEATIVDATGEKARVTKPGLINTDLILGGTPA